VAVVDVPAPATRRAKPSAGWATAQPRQPEVENEIGNVGTVDGRTATRNDGPVNRAGGTSGAILGGCRCDDDDVSQFRADHEELVRQILSKGWAEQAGTSSSPFESARLGTTTGGRVFLSVPSPRRGARKKSQPGLKNSNAFVRPTEHTGAAQHVAIAVGNGKTESERPQAR